MLKFIPFLGLFLFSFVAADQAKPIARSDAESPAVKRVEVRAGTDGFALPGEDVEGGPATVEGIQYRDWTVITEAELNAVDPGYRALVARILAGNADKRVMREYYFNHWRVQPFDQPVPEGWRQAATEQLNDIEKQKQGIAYFKAKRAERLASSTSFSNEQQFGMNAPASSGTPAIVGGVQAEGRWVPIGPYNIAGRMTGLDSVPENENQIYASAADGGVWRTNDAGATWERLSDFEETLSGGAIKLDPTNSRIIYFGTGEGNNAIDNYPGIGVLKSVDGGASWTKSNFFSNIVRRLAIHESDPNRLYAAGQSGCYVSTDAGANFTLMSGGLPTTSSASDVLIKPNDPSTVFCAIWNEGIYRSQDYGDSWTRLDNGLPIATTEGRIALAVSKNNPDVVLAGMAEANGTLYKTTDGGDTWVKLNGGTALGYCGGQCWYDNAVGVDPDDPTLMYAAGISAYRSLDGGNTWSTMSSGVHVDHHYVHTPRAGVVALANDGGVYMSTNSGGSWDEWSFPNMDTTQYYGICRRPDDDVWAFGGTQDNGSHRRNPDGSWSQVRGGDGGMCMSGPAGSGVIVGEYQNHNMWRSSNDGSSWTSANGGISGTDPKSWVGIMTEDPSDRNNMWTGTNRIYRSMDARATNWVAVSGPLYFSLQVTALEVAPSNSEVVYAGFSGGGVYKTTNGLSTPVNWSSIRDQASMPQSSVRRIRVHPEDENTAYLVFSGYGSQRLWKTINGGSTWSVITGDLSDVPVNDILIDADNPGTLIVATDLGVFRSDNDGVNWYGFSNGLPLAAGIMFTYNRDTGHLRLGTHGRSMWDWQPAETAPVPVPDGNQIAGAPLTMDRLASGQVRVSWDAEGCTGNQYNLFWGDLANVSSLTYDGALCDAGNSGRFEFDLPETGSGNAFFLLASEGTAGDESAHGFMRSAGSESERNASGVGFCGVTSQVSTLTCP